MNKEGQKKLNYNNQGERDTKAWVNFAVVGRSRSYLIFPILEIPKRCRFTNTKWSNKCNFKKRSSLFSSSSHHNYHVHHDLKTSLMKYKDPCHFPPFFMKVNYFQSKYLMLTTSGNSNKVKIITINI